MRCERVEVAVVLRGLDDIGGDVCPVYTLERWSLSIQRCTNITLASFTMVY